MAFDAYGLTKSQDIVKRYLLENICRKALTEKSLKAYNKQINYVSRLHKKERKMFSNSLNSSVISDDRKFWKTVKPLFSNKGDYGNKIKLIENEEIMTTLQLEQNETTVASLDIHKNPYTVGKVENMSDPVEKAKRNSNFMQVFCLSKVKLAKTFLKIYFVLMK